MIKILAACGAGVNSSHQIKSALEEELSSRGYDVQCDAVMVKDINEDLIKGKVDIPRIQVVNPVGSGDSTVAGIASGLFHKETDQELLIKANVLGMLNAQEKMTGHVNMANYQGLYDQLIVKEV